MEMRCPNSLSDNTRTNGYEALDSVGDLGSGEWCSERVIPCSNSRFGCPEKLKRKDMNHHVKYECKYEPVRPFLEQQELRIKQLEKEVEELRKRAHSPDRSSPWEPVAQDTIFVPVDKLTQVFIKCPSKNLLCVQVFLKSDTPAYLFKRIEQAWNIKPQQCQLRISFRSKVLVATETLASQGVERDSTLQVVPVISS